MPNVWIVNDAGHPYEAAKTFGDLKPLTIDSVNPLSFDRLSKKMAASIVRYATKEDYLLLSGGPALNALVVSLWLIQFGEANLLLWDARKRKYKPVVASTSHFANLLDDALVKR